MESSKEMRLNKVETVETEISESGASSDEFVSQENNSDNLDEISDENTTSLDKKGKRNSTDSEVKKVTKKVKFDETTNLPSSSKTLQKTKKEKFIQTTNHPNSNKTTQKKKKPVADSSSDEINLEVPYNDDSDEEDNDADCLFCTNMYSADTHGEQCV
ncbi:unnamed protein product [Psylliodes chrysocephalus]|uniref:Uncharacterized protein n=1 Tax=Psylliodes chrysocephalus TaxID=3402493 RepID=A0A9P0D5H7_9CUCU|nr:unnamed protein product [Psylliodes chrysocephala]